MYYIAVWHFCNLTTIFLLPGLGHEVDLLDQFNRLVCRGQQTSQSQVHGRPIKDGWVPVMVTDIISKNKVEPWQEYPTHSGEVEAGSFVAWPTDYTRHRQSGHMHKQNVSEVEVLKDGLHPDQFVSPRTIMSRERQLRSRK